MSRPLKIHESDSDHTQYHDDNWTPTSASPLKTAYKQTGETLNFAIGRGKRLLKSIHRKIGNEASSADKIMHKHPYLAAIAGIGGGLAIGYLVAGKLTHRTEKELTE